MRWNCTRIVFYKIIQYSITTVIVCSVVHAGVSCSLQHERNTHAPSLPSQIRQSDGFLEVGIDLLEV